jgi:hypothetical protein
MTWQNAKCAGKKKDAVHVSDTNFQTDGNQQVEIWFVEGSDTFTPCVAMTSSESRLGAMSRTNIHHGRAATGHFATSD